MCTLTFIAIDHGGVRLVHSRDEQRSRSDGLPPTEWTSGGYRLVSPRDPDAGGTWVAGRDDGVILAVMNRNPEPPPALDRSSLRSRGLLIESLAARPPAELPDALGSIEASRFAPFRAFAAIPAANGDAPQIWAAEWDRSAPSPDAVPVVTRHTPPVCWASSGLGDSIVADRVPLFDETVAASPTPDEQDAYHRHAWEGRGAASVWMSRADARTVSITTVEAFPTPGDGESATDADRVRITCLPLHAGATPDAPMTAGDPASATLQARNLASRGG